MAQKSASCPKCGTMISYNAGAASVVCPGCGIALERVRRKRETPAKPAAASWTVPLVLLAIVGGVLGTWLLSQATLGVGIVGLACLAAILARLAQASGQHADIMQALRQERRDQ